MNRIVVEGEYVGRVLKPGMTVKYTLDIPEICLTEKNNALVLTHDGLKLTIAKTMFELAEEGKAPYCVCLGVFPGRLNPTVENGAVRNMRPDNYDMNTSEYADFLVDEFIPFIEEAHSLSFSKSPDMHMVAGGSSGGISAFIMAYYRNDYFRRVYTSSPSFLSMYKGDEVLPMVRKCEPKPMRVYLEYSEDEPNDFFGSSYSVGNEFEKALKFSGYDYMCNYYPGEGHCAYYDHECQRRYEGFTFLWENYLTQSLGIKGRSFRSDEVLYPDEDWCVVQEFPPKRVIEGINGSYSIENNKIAFTKKDGEKIVFDEKFKNLSSLEISPDLWRLYAADLDRGCIYAYTLDANSLICGKYVFSTLHQKTDFYYPGAIDMCTDGVGRVFAVTEMGIQVCRGCGLVDVILLLPNNELPSDINIKGDSLYVKTDSAVFVRKLKTKEFADYDGTLFGLSYYD